MLRDQLHILRERKRLGESDRKLATYFGCSVGFIKELLLAIEKR